MIPRADQYCVYVLCSERTGRRYVGSCQDIPARLRRHNEGRSKATRHGVPWSLVYVERFSTRAAAGERERFYKTGRGREKLDTLLQWHGTTPV